MKKILNYLAYILIIILVFNVIFHGFGLITFIFGVASNLLKIIVAIVISLLLIFVFNILKEVFVDHEETKWNKEADELHQKVVEKVDGKKIEDFKAAGTRSKK